MAHYELSEAFVNCFSIFRTHKSIYEYHVNPGEFSSGETF